MKNEENEKTFKGFPGYGEVMTVQEFRDAVEAGMFIDYDGHGQTIVNDEVTPNIVTPSTVDSIASDVTRIIWFNR